MITLAAIPMLAGAMEELTVADMGLLSTEVGPVIDAINATGYGLTLGILSRIDDTIENIVKRAHVGNC